MRAVRFGAALAVVLVATAGPALADGSAATASAPAPAATATPAVTVAPATGATVTKVVLSAGEADGANHVYFAKVLDADGNPIAGAELDISALTDNPDLRARTTPMYPTKDPTVYGANLTYPSDGDWVVTIRVHEPVQYVELFVDKVTGVGTPDPHALTASRKAVLRNNPNFYALYDPYGPLAQGGRSLTVASAALDASASDHGASVGDHGSVAGALDAEHRDGVDPTALAMMVLHSLAAAAWLVAVLGLALANRLGPGPARNDLVAWVSRRYAALAGGGMLVLLITGLNNVRDASAGLTTPSELVGTGTGLAYFAVFAFKMALTAGSLATTWQIHRLLSSPERARVRPLLSAGAMADDGPSPRVLKLAEANATFGGLIILSVALLGQLHQPLH